MKTTSSIRVEMQGGLAVVNMAQGAHGNPFERAASLAHNTPVGRDMIEGRLATLRRRRP